MVVLPGRAKHALTARLDRLDSDAIARVQVLDSLANIDHFTSPLVTQNDRVLDASQRVRRVASGDRPVVVLVQVAAADAVVQDSQLDLSGTDSRLRNILQAQILTAVENG
jgi:hypothetical protein